METKETFDVVVVGGGPAGAIAAERLAGAGRKVALLDKAGRIKPCGGAIPPRLIRDFAIPERLLCAKARVARATAPSGRDVDMPIEDGFVGLVDRAEFDEYLRDRAAAAGAERRKGAFVRLERQDDGSVLVRYRTGRGDGEENLKTLSARCIVGADGARSEVARQAIGLEDLPGSVFAYHEIVETPAGWDGARCDILYDGRLSPDFYAWVFPHGPTMSAGLGSAHKGFSIRAATAALRARTGLADARTVRTEGAPLPLKPARRWDDGRNVVLAGDAAGAVAPASGEGIYYAMVTGACAADAAGRFLDTGDARALAGARRAFMAEHGKVFFILGIMQHFWYRNDARRERFVAMCADKDVQRLTWQAYMNKELVKADHAAHARIFFKDLGHLFGFARA